MVEGPVSGGALPATSQASLLAPEPELGVLVGFLEFIEGGRAVPLSELLHRLLLKARRLTDAEAGSIFLMRGRGSKRYLEAGCLQNDTVELGRPQRIVLPLDKDSIAGYVAMTGETVFIDDLQAIGDRPFTFGRDVGARFGYVSRTMLCFPLANEDGTVVAVMHLINRRPPGSQAPMPFERGYASLIWLVNHFAGRAIERAAMTESVLRKNARLRKQRRIIADLHAKTEEAFMLSIRLLAKAAELHDEVTGNHILRVNEYSFALATRLGKPRAWCHEIRFSAQLHDVGKMSVDAAVLKKTGILTDEEWQEMRRHPLYGYEILRTSPRLSMAADIARCHHEKWDGSGYPAGLAGEAIPLAARVVALADIYDALRSPRSYKDGLGHDETCRIILDGDGRIDPRRHFDPHVLAAFAATHEEMDRIWRTLQDAPEPPAAPF